MVEDPAIEGSAASWTAREGKPEEVAAARALLRVSPPVSSAIALPMPPSSSPSLAAAGDRASSEDAVHVQYPAVRRARSGSVGLDALADVASHETEVLGRIAGSLDSSLPVSAPGLTPKTDNPDAAVVVSGPATSGSDVDSDDSVVMPPPPRRRPRSVSNPEGMMAWGETSSFPSSSSSSLLTTRRPFLEATSERLHLLIPTSLLEEELARLSAAVQLSSRLGLERGIIAEEHEYDEDEDTHEASSSGDTSEHKENSCVLDDDEDCGNGSNDEQDMDPEALLQRARARLLEDLLEGRMGSADKGAFTLPHALDKYQNVYNKNGRVGIYTPAERAAIIARFQRKRSRRVWNKKIRYNCRKSLADRRLRVKGRFVKRSEQEQLARDRTRAAGEEVATEAQSDEDMPNVNDPDAGFAPTVDQPYRRLRRHTVT